MFDVKYVYCKLQIKRKLQPQQLQNLQVTHLMHIYMDTGQYGFIRFSIRYHIIHFQDNAGNDVGVTMDDTIVPEDKGVVCLKISVT